MVIVASRATRTPLQRTPRERAKLRCTKDFVVPALHDRAAGPPPGYPKYQFVTPNSLHRSLQVRYIGHIFFSRKAFVIQAFDCCALTLTDDKEERDLQRKRETEYARANAAPSSGATWQYSWWHFACVCTEMRVRARFFFRASLCIICTYGILTGRSALTQFF